MGEGAEIMWKDCLTIESFILLLVPSSYTFFFIVVLFVFGGEKKDC